MNFKRLSKHFPELAHLSSGEQQALLTQADKALNNAETPLAALGRKLFDACIFLLLCLLLIKKVGPALGLAPEVMATLLILVLLPLYFILQQKRYLKRLRRQLAKTNP
jgi:Flp pilus assembly protein TadB